MLVSSAIFEVFSIWYSYVLLVFHEVPAWRYGAMMLAYNPRMILKKILLLLPRLLDLTHSSVGAPKMTAGRDLLFSSFFIPFSVLFHFITTLLSHVALDGLRFSFRHFRFCDNCWFFLLLFSSILSSSSTACLSLYPIVFLPRCFQ